jgi:hypothetical protein
MTASSKGRAIKWFPGLIAVFIGCVLWVIAAFVANDTRDFLRRAVSADGVVTRLNAGGAHPEVQFTAANGQTFEYPQGGAIGGYERGQRVRVLYISDDISNTACLDDPGALWFDAGIMAGLGLAFVFAGGFTIWRDSPRDLSERNRHVAHAQE